MLPMRVQAANQNHMLLSFIVAVRRKNQNEQQPSGTKMYHVTKGANNAAGKAPNVLQLNMLPWEVRTETSTTRRINPMIGAT